MKYVVVILDGAAGWPLPELGGRTTLQVASTPNLDALVGIGTLGMAHTVPEGFEPSSSAACTSILGYDPVADYVGRGAIEAASLGIDLAPDEVALRCNLVNIGEGRMRSYSAGHITSQESHAIVEELAAALNDGTYRLYPGVAYRHILVVRGHRELLHLTYTPPHDIPDREIDPHLPRGDGASVLLDFMERSRPLLESCWVNRARRDDGKLPASDVWLFWPGVAPSGMMPFAARRGLRAALTSGVDLLNGLAVLAGIDRLQIAGVTDGSDNDYAAQAVGALQALEDHELVVVHVESPDEAGHAGDIDEKVRAIEAIDREVMARIREYPAALRVLAMPDHPTPVALKTHVGEPVPFVLSGPGIAHNGASVYDETTAAWTRLTVDPGRQVMDLLLA